MFSFRTCHVVDRECLPDEYHLVLHKVTYLHWAKECILVLVNIFCTVVVSVATSLLLFLLSPMLWLIYGLHFSLSNIHH